MLDSMSLAASFDGPFVSVIVPAYNATRTLERTLRRLSALSYPAYEVIVVDDGSRDETVQQVRGYVVRLAILEKNSGAGVARMVGASLARGELLAFTDSDVIVPVDWLEQGLALLEETGAIAASGPFTGSAGDSFVERFCYHYLRDRETTERSYVSTCSTANALIRADVFRETGGFPIYGLGRNPKEAFQGHEDTNWAYIATRDPKNKIVWEPSFGVTHIFRDSLASLLKQQWFIASVVTVSSFRFRGMLSGPSNFRKSSTMLHMAVTWFGTLAFLALLVAGLFSPLAWAGAAACAAAVLWSLLSHRSLLQAVRRDRGAGTLLRSLVWLYLMYIAFDMGTITALLRLVTAGFQFRDIDQLPSFRLEERAGDTDERGHATRAPGQG